jgi:hypothetical protein
MNLLSQPVADAKNVTLYHFKENIPFLFESYKLRMSRPSLPRTEYSCLDGGLGQGRTILG